jgi:hypothetical protein
MKKIFITVVLLLVIVSLKGAAQDMTPPKPVENKVFDAMTGEWTSESNMMGTIYTENLKVYWHLNHQFIFMELKSASKSDPTKTYNGFGIFGADAGSSSKVWWFDDWGMGAVATGSGTFGDMKYLTTTSNAMYKGSHNFEIKGDGMVMTSNTTWMEGEKEMKMEGKIVYKRK